MKDNHVVPLEVLIEKFESLPGIGHKTAQRLAYHVLGRSKQEAKDFARAIVEAHERIHYCDSCCNLTDKKTCNICASSTRDRSIICVVEDPKDVIALERTNDYNSLYHVLHGCISPLNGIGPEQITIRQLILRINDEVKEIVMATNPTVEGDATAMYISKLLKPLGVRVTRLAYGIPVGGDLEYADEVTLSKAMEGRRDL